MRFLIVLAAGLFEHRLALAQPNQPQSATSAAVLSDKPRFIHHILDANLQALGADIGDRDGSGRAEIIACDASGIYRFAAGQKTVIDQSKTPSLLIHLRTSDIDRDGDIDVVAADHRNGTILYYENPGHPPAKSQPWPRHIVDHRIQGAHAIAIADINRDGRPDIIASGEANASPPDTLLVRTGGRTTFNSRNDL